MWTVRTPQEIKKKSYGKLEKCSKEEDITSGWTESAHAPAEHPPTPCVMRGSGFVGLPFVAAGVVLGLRALGANDNNIPSA